MTMKKMLVVLSVGVVVALATGLSAAAQQAGDAGGTKKERPTGRRSGSLRRALPAEQLSLTVTLQGNRRSGTLIP